MVNVKPSLALCGLVPSVFWNVKLVVNCWMLTGVLNHALESSLPLPSVRRRRVPLSVALPFRLMAPAAKPDPKLMVGLVEFMV